MQVVTPLCGESALDLLKRCGGWYESPVDSEGKILGPLVGYAGKYEDKNDGKKKPFVGSKYANYAAIERHGPANTAVASRLISLIGFGLMGRNLPINSLEGTGITGFVGAPEGGKALAVAMSTLSQRQYIFPDREVIKLKTDDSREVSKLKWGRHAPEAGEFWVISEDTCNNFDTTDTMIELIESTGAKVVAISCFLNRTVKPQFKEFFTLSDKRKIPIIALECREIPEHKQDELEVAHLVKAGRVIWKPKDQWAELMTAMDAK